MPLRPQVAGGSVHWIDDSQGASPTGEASNVSLWDILSRLPRAGLETISEIGPTLQKVGQGGQGAPVQTGNEYLRSVAGLQNKGGESIPEALGKGALEGAINTFVPEAGVDVLANILGEGGGAALAGARGLQKAEKAGEAAAEASRGVARRSATRRLQRRATGKMAPGAPGPEDTPKAPGYHTQRMGSKGVMADSSYSPERPPTQPQADLLQNNATAGATERYILNRAQAAPQASPQEEFSRIGRTMEPLQVSPEPLTTPPPPVSDAQRLQDASDRRVGAQIDQLYQKGPREVQDIYAFMQDWLKNYPDMTLEQFMTIMNAVSGGIF